MNYEVLRLQSFGHASRGDVPEIYVLPLARSGFYLNGDTGRVLCFSCGSEYSSGFTPSSLSSAHGPNCQRFQLNQPIQKGVPSEVLKQNSRQSFHSFEQHAQGSNINSSQSGHTLVNGHADNTTTDSESFHTSNNSTEIEVNQGLTNVHASNIPTNNELSPRLNCLTTSDSNPFSFTKSHIGNSLTYSQQSPRLNSLTSYGTSNSIPFVNGHTNKAITNSQRLLNTSRTINTTSFNVDNSQTNSDQLHPSGPITSIDVITSLINGQSSNEQLQQPNSTTSAYGSDKDHFGIEQTSIEQMQDSIRNDNQEASNRTLPTILQAPESSSSFSATNGSLNADAQVSVPLTLHLNILSYPQFFSRQARLNTFRGWNQTHTHQPEEFAEAGFFFAGYADCVRCFCCVLGLKFWRAGDAITYQHARLRPTCKFNVLLMGQSYVENVQRETQEPHQQQQQPQQQQGANHSAPNESLQPLERTPASEGTFSVEPLPPTDVQASLSSPEINENVSNHEILEPNVARNQEDSGIDAIENDEADSASGLNFSGQETAMVSHQQMPGASNHNEELRVMEREQTYLRERTTCRVCSSRPVCCIFLPCGHVAACQECADKISRCVLCDKVIIGTANIFLA